MLCRARPDVGAVESPRESEAESVASLCSEAVIVASPRSEDDIVASSDSEADNNIRSPWPPAADNTQLSVIIEKLVSCYPVLLMAAVYPVPLLP